MTAPASGAPLADRQGRRIRYLRLSLTEACNFACSYCSPHPHRAGDGLPREAVARLVRIFAGLGVERVRLTGGEPTLRPDLLEVVADIAAVPGIREIALTTNGQLLDRLAGPLRAAGVLRLNVSLDTLRPERLTHLSGRAASLPRILEGLAAAGRAGYASVKTNAVVVRGFNEDELGDLARFAWRQGAIARFIELMPFGEGEPVPMAEVKALLGAQGVRLTPDATRGWGPARHMRGESGEGAGRLEGLVGFIGAMTESFCEDCNRVRVGADGALRACLGGRDRVELLPLLAQGDDAQVAERIREALLAKGDRHDMAAGRGRLLPMIGTGG
ncbi:GTP 3',8-cyclase MoaA [Anaeromyxobacter diazotrophicus]|uniref:Cyclic pyranopterin monophosphate synthase n=1 Tax=Anaeromyxobacter diazotrophicus TaxID=2590199 RepID=A0A7I9VMX8_9BACT|nr:GTP 3',8-cyclase MoaA [Anaeromyxobacter diazotrophicus]GEJ57337.1 cyclic pyranopterin monophosphate synthase [Anaeromyxobacter diazotrophicus]